MVRLPWEMHMLNNKGTVLHAHDFVLLKSAPRFFTADVIWCHTLFLLSEVVEDTRTHAALKGRSLWELIWNKKVELTENSVERGTRIILLWHKKIRSRKSEKFWHDSSKKHWTALGIRNRMHFTGTRSYFLRMYSLALFLKILDSVPSSVSNSLHFA